jgi:hypothetical protein
MAHKTSATFVLYQKILLVNPTEIMIPSLASKERAKNGSKDEQTIVHEAE